METFVVADMVVAGKTLIVVAKAIVDKLKRGTHSCAARLNIGCTIAFLATLLLLTWYWGCRIPASLSVGKIFRLR